MRLDTSDTNCKSPTKRKSSVWVYPPDRPWFEFVFIIILTFVCMLSIISLVISASSAKTARIIATARLETIYQDLKKNEEDLIQLELSHLKDERHFHVNLNLSMKAQTILMKRIAEQLNVPDAEIEKILEKDPNY